MLSGFFFHMQVDMESDITSTPRKFGKKVGKPKLKNFNHELNQFVETVIKVMGTFNGIFETKKRLEMITITVVACSKDHRLLEFDVSKMDTTKLVNSIKAEENKIELLRGYRTSILLKKNNYPRCVVYRKSLNNILPMIAAKHF